MFVTGCKKISKEGPLCIKLDKDMCTIIEAPHSIGVKSIYNSKHTDYYGHEFFEASSMRKINNKYYFVYSSYLGHELCYAISNYPDRDFCMLSFVDDFFGIKGETRSWGRGD